MNLHPPRPPLHGARNWSGLSILSRRSFRSFTTSSFEADDERSDTDAEGLGDGDMSSSSSTIADGHGPRNPMHASTAALYPGYDGRPTSRKELTGWFMYSFAAETFVICGIGL